MDPSQLTTDLLPDFSEDYGAFSHGLSQWRFGDRPVPSARLPHGYRGFDVESYIDQVIETKSREDSLLDTDLKEVLFPARSLSPSRNSITKHPDIPCAWTIDSGVPAEGTARNPLVLGGVHGNEQNGVWCIETLLESIASDQFRLTQGKLTVAVGNPKAVMQGTRHLANDGIDLNRSFCEGINFKNKEEEARRDELKHLFSEASAFLDIHAVSSASVPFAVVDEEKGNIELGRALGVRYLLEFRKELHQQLTQGVTSFYTARELKIPSITIETGINNQVATYQYAYDSMSRFLQHTGVIAEIPPLTFPDMESLHLVVSYIHAKKVADKGVTQDAVAFQYAKDFHNFQRLGAGDLIASEEFTFGGVRHLHVSRADEECYLCFPTKYRDVKADSPDYIYMVAKEAAPLGT